MSGPLLDYIWWLVGGVTVLVVGLKVAIGLLFKRLADASQAED